MATRRDLFLAQGGKCFYCGKYMTAFPNQQTGVNPRGYTRDHFYPKSGEQVIPHSENIVLSCAPCNRGKANTLPTRVQINKHARLYRLVMMVWGEYYG